MVKWFKNIFYVLVAHELKIKCQYLYSIFDDFLVTVMHKSFTPNAVLAVVLIVEMLVWIHIPRSHAKWSTTGFTDKLLLGPSVLGVILYWLYYRHADKVMLKGFAIMFLVISCIAYFLLLWFSFMALKTGYAHASLEWEALMIFVPLLFNIGLLAHISSRSH